MTGKQRILAAFHGGSADTVPFCPNLYYWFYRHSATGTLPPSLAAATHPFEVLRALGADILARWDTQHATREIFRGGECTEEFSGSSGIATPMVTSFNTYPPGASIRRRRFETPHGTLTNAWTLTPEAGADFESEFWWKTWDDYPAIRYFLEARDYVFDATLFDHWVRQVGDDGVMMAHFTQTPLKTFHWLAGAENATLFLADHPGEMRELAAIHQRKALRVLETMVDHPGADVFISLENLDSDFYSPRLYHDYCDDFFRRAAALIHSRGKILVVHACGRNRVLLPLVGSAGVDCLEGLTPPPMGNVALPRAREFSGRETFVVNGGITTELLERTETARDAIFHYTRDLFAAMDGRRRFLFASSCTTPLGARWENLVAFRDAAREYGTI
ncbi:MAG: hypothetical protein NTY38_07520 [Acidobacteria bacterium]|nr:hypothetical protein [Acidobacteriota bacterium]